MMPDYFKEMGGDMPKSEPANDDYSPAKEAAATALATALGIDPGGIDAQAVCDAVKALVKLEE